jgi:hypothetical protein
LNPNRDEVRTAFERVIDPEVRMERGMVLDVEIYAYFKSDWEGLAIRNGPWLEERQAV